MDFGFFPFVAGIIVVAILIGIASKKRTDRAWTAVAQNLGLDYTPRRFGGRRDMRGTVDGCGVRVATVKRGSGKNSTTYTQFTVHYGRHLGLGLRITREGFFSGVAKFFGSQDIRTGDDDFDRRVLIKGDDEDRVNRFLTAARRTQIATAIELFPELEIQDSHVVLEQRGILKSPQGIAGTIRQLVPLATDIGAVRAPQDVDEDRDARPQRYAGPQALPPGSSTPAPPEPVAAPEDHVPEPQLAAEPDDHVPEPAAAAEAPEPAEPQPAGGGALAVGTVCDALFGESSASTDVSRTFEEYYQDQPVRWTATLKSATRFSFDHEFGDQPGTKAQVGLHEVTASYGGKLQVEGFVQLPEEAADALSSRSGETITFEGELMKADGLMRRLYIKNARLLS